MVLFLKQIHRLFVSLFVPCLYFFTALTLTTVFIMACMVGNPKKGYAPASVSAQQVVPHLRRGYDASYTVLAYPALLFELFDRPQGQGSGTVIQCQKGKPIIALTAFHVIEKIALFPAGYVVLYNQENKIRIVTKILKVAKDEDLALVRGIENLKTDCPYVDIAKKEPLLGSVLWTIGTPGGIEKNITNGVYSKKYLVKNHITYRTTLDIFFGNSGGGVFNDAGELVGVVNQLQQYMIQTEDGAFKIPILVPGGSIVLSLETVTKFIGKL